MQAESIIITGASSGIGAALANHYAKAGVTLGLLARNAGRLAEVTAQCEAKGATVLTSCVDVCDAGAMAEWLLEFDSLHPCTLLIANAGISGGSNVDSRAIFSTNVGGVINSVLPIIPRMRERKNGQIAIISSLAGMRGLPSAPAYSASKAAVKAWGEGLRGELTTDNIRVNIVCPGYVKTPLTDSNNFPMPFIMSAEKAAGIIARGLAKNRSRIAFPLALYIPLWLLSCLSPSITDGLFARLPKK